ncbi:MAG: glycosyltransferase [Saprospiraceae bacterium]
MKILLVSPAHPLRGGIAASTERLAQEMQAAGHEVAIHSFSLQYPAFLFPGKTQFSDDPPPPGLKIRTHINSVNPFNWLPSGWKIARERPDLVVVRFWLPFMGPCLGTILRLARWLSGKKFRVAALVDNIVPHEKRPGDRLFARYFVGACDEFVVMSRSVGDEIRQFLKKAPPPLKGSHADESTESAPLQGRGCIRFAPHPIYDNYGEPVGKAVARRQLGLPETAPLVLFFGLIRAYKGLDLLLEALGNARLRQQNVQAIVAGEPYGDWQPYQQIIENQQLEGRTHLFLDFIPADEVRLYFSAADLVVQPYRTATQSGISQIAYHFEKPMVVTNVGGLPEIVTNGVSGYVVEPTAAAIADAVADFFEHKKADSMGVGVRAEKARFSWKNLMEALIG